MILRRRVRAVAGQGEAAEARAERAQLLSRFEINLKQAYEQARRGRTAEKARQTWRRPFARDGFGELEHTPTYDILAPIGMPVPEVIPGEGPRGRARRRYMSKQPRRTPVAERGGGASSSSSRP